MPYLFSYGTLQQEDVQLSIFGRAMTGCPDSLPGFVISLLKVDDLEVVAKSGKTHHPIVRFTGEAHEVIEGTRFEITDAELIEADRYEVANYTRVAVKLASGIKAWVYVDARTATQMESDLSSPSHESPLP